MIPVLADLNRAAIRQLERDNLLYPTHLCKIPESEWPGPREGWLRPIAMFRSRHFCVQVFDEGAVIRLSVNRTSVDERTLRWREDISWDDLQRLKAEAGYADREAVEIYPPAGDEVNVANMRHPWILHARLPFSWGSLWVIGVKGNETRHWSTHYRGPLLVHAAKTICVDVAPELAEICEAHFGARWASELPRGALIGVVELISCRQTELCHVDAEEQACGNYAPGRFAWGAQNAYQFCQPIPYRGHQGLFDVPAELVAPMLAGGSVAAPPTPQGRLL